MVRCRPIPYFRGAIALPTVAAAVIAVGCAAAAVSMAPTAFAASLSAEATSEPAAAGAAVTDGRTAVPKPDFRAEVISLARERAAKPYLPIPDVTGGALARSYDSYRRIRFLEKNAHWYRRPPGFEVHPLPLGWLFKRPVRLLTLPRGASAPVPLTFPVSAFDDQRIGQPPAPVIADMPLSGFRINGPLNAEARSDEIIAFQGASYFRALGKNHAYGLSARGLAIGTASSRGEEFPEFQKFWIEEPALGAREIVVHALLDSQSTTGAYRFRIRPGVETLIDTDVTLFPRRDLAEIGIAPLTSMYWLGPIAQPRSFDFRPRVHDSDGLAILNGNGERIWRPINNPAALQISVFVDDAIGGFGLMQRERGFDAYQDLEARYERRPSLWIEPKSGFGPGNIILVEIPTENEVNDNVVAFWRPKEPVRAGNATSFSYLMRWRDRAPTIERGPWVTSSRSGQALVDKAAIRFVVDYVDATLFEGEEMPEAKVTVSGGEVVSPLVQKNPETGGLRATFLFKPGNRDRADLRLNLGSWAGRTPETWIYRWTRP